MHKRPRLSFSSAWASRLLAKASWAKQFGNHLGKLVSAQDLKSDLIGGLLEQIQVTRLTFFDQLRGQRGDTDASLTRGIFQTYCGTRPGRHVCDAWLTGWSRHRNRPEGYSIRLENFDEWEKRDGGNPGSCPPFRLVPKGWPMNLACNPTSTKQQFDEAHFAPWDTEKLIPEINLLQFMELQRRKPYDDSHPPKYLIGYALPTTVDRNGATQQKIHTWPEDKIGEMIKPAPIDWAKWRTEREASFQDNDAGPSRGAGLPVVAKRNSVTAAVQPLNGQQRRRLKALGR